MIIRIPKLGKFELSARLIKSNEPDDEYKFKSSNEYILLRDAIRSYFRTKTPESTYDFYKHYRGHSHYTSRKFTRAIFRLLKTCPQRLEIVERKRKGKEPLNV